MRTAQFAWNDPLTRARTESQARGCANVRILPITILLSKHCIQTFHRFNPPQGSIEPPIKRLELLRTSELQGSQAQASFCDSLPIRPALALASRDFMTQNRLVEAKCVPMRGTVNQMPWFRSAISTMGDSAVWCRSRNTLPDANTHPIDDSGVSQFSKLIGFILFFA